MYVEKLIIVNYKSCQYLDLHLEKNSPNILIGINDCGKSSILKAIGLLLNEKPEFNFEKEDKQKNDISFTPCPNEDLATNLKALGLPTFPDYVTGVHGTLENISKTIVFGCLHIEALDYEKVKNNRPSNHLLWVLDHAQDDKIWLARVFNGNSHDFFDFLLTYDQEDKPIELFNASQKILQGAREEYGVTDEDVKNENRKGRYTNFELVRAIYSKLKLTQSWAPYTRKNDKWFFPIFHYLDWNVSIEQLEIHTKELIGTKIQNEFDKANKKARKQSKKAQAIVNAELQKISGEVTEDLPHVTGIEAQISFNIQTKLTDFLVRKIYSTGAVHMDNQGEGLKRQIWFGLLKWKAKEDSQTKHEGKQFIWCFDEPETHLYPKAQREFFDLIKKISTQNIQTLLSTHSSIFLDKAKLTSINRVELDDNGISSYTKCTTIDDIFSSLKLRNSDFLFFDRFLIIEGDTEAHLLPQLFRLYAGKTLEDENIRLVNLHGKNKLEQNKGILEGILHNFRKNNDQLVFILDNDASFKLFKNRNLPIPPNFFFIGHQDLEDSFCPTLWKSIIDAKFGEKIEVSIEEIEEIRAQIPNDREEDKNGKFYVLLQNHLREKLQEVDPDGNFYYDLLPGKGADSAALIMDHIQGPAQFNAELRKAFDTLSNLPKTQTITVKQEEEVIEEDLAVVPKRRRNRRKILPE